jgi:mannose-6-phosphate isomerase-like protein (cupin superfamily)
MTGFSVNIEQATEDNDFFRQVLYTGTHAQLVVMSLKPGEDIGKEVHDHVDQFIRVEEGTGESIIDGESTALSDGMAIVIPAGAEHNVINTSATASLKLYTLYSPPNHPDGTVHKTKADAMEAEEHEHNR